MIALVYLTSLPVLVLLHGYTVQTLWRWFIIPHFQVEPLPFVTALGLALFVSYMAVGTVPSEEDIVAAIITAWIRPIMTLGFGWAYVSIF